MRINTLSSKRDVIDIKTIEYLRQYLPKEIYRTVEANQSILTEIRIRREKPLSLTLARGVCGAYGYGENHVCPFIVNNEMMDQIITAVCHNSLYTHMNSMTEGYIAMKEGFRIGVAGKAVCEKGIISNLSSINSLNIRIPRFIYNISLEIYSLLAKTFFEKSILLFSPPNMGKTTILKDLIRQLSSGAPPRRVAVIDTRCEIETEPLKECCHVDFLSGYPRGKGIEIATRTLSPQYIVCDEIGAKEEAISLLAAQNAGVPVIASAHASSVEELLLRENIKILHERRLFSYYIGIRSLQFDSAPNFTFTKV